jgi:hypothetical protein
VDRDTRRWIFDSIAWLVGLVAAVVLVAEAAADEHRLATPANAAWKSECGSCHIAYPPQLLPARSWQTIMNTLDRHFGVDAAVDPPVKAAIGAFLEANAGREGSKRADTSALRISETRWFRHEHGSVPATVWGSPAVRGPADCAACHRQADTGDFSERSVRLPR